MTKEELDICLKNISIYFNTLKYKKLHDTKNLLSKEMQQLLRRSK
jgi:hypothetical protein